MIKIENFGTLATGERVLRYTLVNQNGTSLSVLNYGATVQSLVYKGKDVCVGFEDAADYDHNEAYLGATVGRVAGRLTNSCFPFGGDVCRIQCKEGNALHGGDDGFSFRFWNVDVIEASDDPSIRFSLVSPDGDMGFPGEIAVSVVFTLTEEDVWRLEYEAVSDKDTVVNLTNHMYFNFDGYDGEDVRNTLVTIHADRFLRLSEDLLPSGETPDVEGTAFDFRSEKSLQAALDRSHPMLEAAKGLDTGFCVGDEGTFRHVATMRSQNSGIGTHCYTDMPLLQVYMGNYLHFAKGKGGPLYQYQGVCMETQRYSDAPNHPEFPDITLCAGDTFRTCTEFRFFS